MDTLDNLSCQYGSRSTEILFLIHMFQVLPIGLLLILLKKVIVFVTLQFTLRHSETLWHTMDTLSTLRAKVIFLMFPQTNELWPHQFVEVSRKIFLFYCK